ncbi:senecionine N-oxygenase-like [Andrena cerasifolii]|uniref:senecionine N-oxygenase-like n=1 Tax=Andrena cerasifolii TaxID=2819439 RepID=UPI004037D503
MKIAVIGAGAAGIAAVRHCRANNSNEVICYEKTDQVGGTWVYREETGADQYGLKIHTSMYKSLRANLPKEIMGYPDYPAPEDPESYLTRAQILHFLNSYCDHFNIRECIRLLHNVESVGPSKGERKWLIKAKDLQRDVVTSETFDAVMICNGHFSEPSVPKLKGQDIFQGEQLHSHDYRTPDVFTDQTVVIFGGGPSGLDLALEVSRTAKRVFFSHHLKGMETKFPDNVVQKPDVAELTERGVLFEDGTGETVDAMFYCTGYDYSFPFLDEKCGVRVKSSMVTPLWKHVVSIENPSLVFIGLPKGICAFNMSDLQIRFVLEFWSGKKDFPSKSDMLRDEAEELEQLSGKGVAKRQFHVMEERQGDYYADLAKASGIKPLAPVIASLYNECNKRFFENLLCYRQVKYRIVDDNNFVRF